MKSNELSLAEALKMYLARSPFKAQYDAARIEACWESVVGKTISRYTKSLKLNQHRLIITTEVAPLKQELLFSRDMIRTRINEALGEPIVEEVVIR